MLRTIGLTDRWCSESNRLHPDVNFLIEYVEFDHSPSVFSSGNLCQGVVTTDPYSPDYFLHPTGPSITRYTVVVGR